MMKTKTICRSILLMAMFVGLSSSCQNEFKAIQKQQEKEVMLKAALSEILSLNYPEYIMPNTDFIIDISTSCGQLNIERAYILGEDGITKVYRGLSCNNIPEAAQFESIGFCSCQGKQYTENWPEYGTYLYRLTLDPNPVSGISSACSTCTEETISEKVSNCFEVKVCRIETAFGGSKHGKGSALWHIFDTESLARAGNLDWEQDISAAGNIVIGKIIYDGTTLTIDLDEGWSLLEGEEEPVKLEGFGVEPKSRLPADKFKLYKGSDLTLNLSALKGNGLRYYAIHLDVQTANPEYF